MILSSNNVLVRPPLGSTGILFEAAIDADQSCFRSTNQGRATCSVSELGVMLASVGPAIVLLTVIGLALSTTTHLIVISTMAIETIVKPEIQQSRETGTL